MLNQKLQQKLIQKLSPQQIQLMKLLQLPAMALEQRIKEELEENPALEDANDEENYDDSVGDQQEDTDNEPDTDEEMEKEIEESEREPEEISLEDYLDDDEIPAYKLNTYDHNPDEEGRKEIPFSVGASFQEHLLSQLGMRKLNEKQYEIAKYIIGNLDDSGYLNRELSAMCDDLAFTQNIHTNQKELEELLAVIQEFEPNGVGARNLQECLLIQLNKVENPGQATEVAKTILKKFFNEFTKKHYDKIQKRLDINDDELKKAIGEILKLNPKPGNSLVDTAKPNHYITPDFTITNTDGILELTLNSKNTPELRVNKAYMEMIESLATNKNKSGQEKDLAVFVKQKLDSAKWFIDMIKQRQDTLYRTMKSIMDYQIDYFTEGDETLLRPMILKDIAERVLLDISTISRVVNSKYVQTPFGTFLLKSFFSESLQTELGEEVSTREVKKILSDCIEAENKKKPLTDERLTKILKDKGYNIARRTVAKYREQLEIPVARLRKEL